MRFIYQPRGLKLALENYLEFNNMDKEIQKLIDDFVTALNDNEEKLLDFNKKITEVYNSSQSQMDHLSARLNNQFEERKINEEEYLKTLKEEKNKILNESEITIQNIIKNYK